jgi:hypothetical protein
MNSLCRPASSKSGPGSGSESPEPDGFTNAGRGHAARRYSWIRTPSTFRCVTVLGFGSVRLEPVLGRSHI